MLIVELKPRLEVEAPSLITLSINIKYSFRMTGSQMLTLNLSLFHHALSDNKNITPARACLLV